MPVAKALTSSAKDEWCTPPEVLERVYQVGPIVLDPCPHNMSPVLAEDRNFDTCGLKIEWHPTGELVYVNPPYSNVGDWMAKCVDEASLGAEIIALVPARTETQWFKWVWDYADSVCFWEGRLKFWEDGEPGKHSAPFPSAVVYYGQRVRRFEAAFAGAGKVVRL